MYAMVNVQQYQIVSTGYSLSECQENYYQLLKENNIIQESDIAPVEDTEAKTESVSAAIAEIRTANIDGNTIFYLLLDGYDSYFTVSAKEYPIAAILNAGDTVTLTYKPQEGTLIEVETLTVQ